MEKNGDEKSLFEDTRAAFVNYIPMVKQVAMVNTASSTNDLDKTKKNEQDIKTHDDNPWWWLSDKEEY